MLPRVPRVPASASSASDPLASRDHALRQTVCHDL
jgi:hypothetical protein